MKTIRFFPLLLILVLTGCAELMQIAQQTLDEGKPLTQNEIIAGLKEALIVGTNKSADKLGVTDGYYKDELVKILLPPEADIIVKNINKIPGGNQLIEDVLLKINRAAEDAVSEAKPIFVNSVTSMTISDAVGILKGDDNAATQYLHKTTYNELSGLYRPKIKASVEKKLVGDISTAQSWNLLTGKWNDVANSIVGQIAGFKPVEIDLDEYLTNKALDGLFLKIEAEEKLIRKDPLARASELLKRVFGSLDA
ncbi:MAG: DUF4197 domain-containing protein [Prolixibacteraceae bacterium]|jgi:hypothetical protein|nr:DUF4197 domain-containing protein [Prolixibacteraceae bacterium]MBT6765832.1 DUF4197 domain-containing protein [Prolixibacteraceae bacterium]MBT7000014.1 DUF4197 domain-containing protein [Prolixibacteraceae bacterium]MBT7395490.1 DUF4197 domain-containing protein [Prolixibacteraceae bacterium]